MQNVNRPRFCDHKEPSTDSFRFRSSGACWVRSAGGTRRAQGRGDRQLLEHLLEGPALVLRVLELQRGVLLQGVDPLQNCAQTHLRHWRANGAATAGGNPNALRRGRDVACGKSTVP